MKYYFLVALLSLTSYGFSQTHLSPEDFDFVLKGSNIQVIKLTTDSNSTAFAIMVQDEVKPHYHKAHTESLFVQAGEAEMIMNDSTYTIKKGDFIVIPPNTIHSVKVTSTEPLKVISIQAPEFLGKDRHFVEIE